MRGFQRRGAPTCIVAAAWIVTACGSGSREPAQPAPQPAIAEASASGIAKARADSLRYPYTEADVQFMGAMIGHHSQALVMAGWAPTHDASPAVRRLADRITNGQQDEIASMEQWLRERRQPVPDPRAAGTMSMHGDGHEGHAMMPGMLTEPQLRQLDAARGPEFDRLFLTFMIQHHRGAVSMVQSLFGTNRAAQDETVFKFANDVSADQSTEIARMETMLAALPPER
ncbi:MAG TPA: DUF305 domain-containing protein [Gemmatimonadales bacterium]|nr:DUF305 domain-containing protein [Gemmatimonadales bacterium]